MSESHKIGSKDGTQEVKLDFHAIKSEDGGEDVKMSEGYNMSVGDGIKKKPKTRKRRLSTMMDEGHMQMPEKLYKRIILSLTKPSYLLNLGLDSKHVRCENRNRLRYLLRTLARQRNWADASGVLSVLLKGTSKERCPVANRLKYTVSMELLKHVESDQIKPIRFKNVYDIWMKRIASMEGSPIEDKFVVHLEFILFCLTRGDVDGAYQAAMSLMQEREFGRHLMSNMITGLTFCQRWCSSIPIEMQWRDSDLIYSPTRSDFSGVRFNHQVETSDGHDTVYSHQVDTHFRHDSDTSVMIEKRISIEDDNGLQREGPVEGDVGLQRETCTPHRQPQGFYMISTENEASISNDGGPLNYTSFFYSLEGLDSWLLPIRLPKPNEDYENFNKQHSKLLNDDYKNAVKYLRIALYSTPPISAALLPFIQLLLIGGRVDEAINEVEKFCSISNTELPIRLRASLSKCFHPKNCDTLSTCIEDILKKDPTCCHSLARLIDMQHNGEYSWESLLEMIALHLDATHADYNTWREFASCFLKLFHYDEDRMSVCLDGSEGEQRHRSSIRYDKAPKILTEGKSGKNWMLRCRWWMRRHFSKDIIASEIATGDLQLITYKAACASHMYGQEFDYVVKAYAYLEKENCSDLFKFLRNHMRDSIRLQSYILHKS